MNELIGVGVLLSAIVGGLLAFARPLSRWLVSAKARRLRAALSERMREEWLAELDALAARVSQLAFAIALTLTRRHSFAAEDESVFASPHRSPITVATFGGWPSVVVITTVVVAAIAYAASFLITPLYRSRTRLVVVPQQISPRFVESSPRMPLEERVRELSATALSDQRLEKVIREFDLYKFDRDARRESGAALDRMRRDLSIEVHPDGIAIAYTSSNPRTAMIVTERFASLFVQAGMESRGALGTATLAFLNTRLADVRSRLLDRTSNTGTSPSSESDAVRPLDHESLRRSYRDLLLKKEQARLSAFVEAVQVGEQFRIFDGAPLPEAPISPDRTRLALLGAVIGFCFGIAMMVAGRIGSSRRPQKMLAQS